MVLGYEEYKKIDDIKNIFKEKLNYLNNIKVKL